MLIAAVVSAAAVANFCPPEFPDQFSHTYNSATSLKCRATNEPYAKLTANSEAEFTRDFLCQPSSDDYPCCFGLVWPGASPSLDRSVLCAADLAALDTSRDMVGSVLNQGAGLTCDAGPDVLIPDLTNVPYTAAIVDCTGFGATPEPADDSGLSPGAIAGIAVGSAAFVGLVVGLAVCL